MGDLERIVASELSQHFGSDSPDGEDYMLAGGIIFRLRKHGVFVDEPQAEIPEELRRVLQRLRMVTGTYTIDSGNPGNLRRVFSLMSEDIEGAADRIERLFATVLAENAELRARLGASA